MAGKLDTQDGSTPPETGVPTPSFCVMKFYGYAATANTNAHGSAALIQSQGRAPWLGQSRARKKAWVDEARAERAGNAQRLTGAR